MNDQPVFPVVLCGGSGQRLWPASTTETPKPFLRLSGARSLFQDSVVRVALLAVGGGQVVVVANVAHVAIVRRQLADIGVTGVILAEPTGRNSAPAIAAAAYWIVDRAPDGIAVIVPSDHFIPEPAKFQAAVLDALLATSAGLITTLGLQPTGPATGYGYILPETTVKTGVRAVTSFVEKPDVAQAAQLILDGCLWNSGNFIARAQILIDELNRHVPEVATAAQAALSASREDGETLYLGEAFTQCVATSFDTAIMERTRLAAVLPVSFGWSDIGTWAAVWEASDRDASGNAFPKSAWVSGTSNTLVRAPPTFRVAVVGVQNTAVVVEDNRVLVCSLDASQDVGRIPDAMRQRDGPQSGSQTLRSTAEWFRSWLETAALPVWATLGFDWASGVFYEGLNLNGSVHDPYRRTRVQARQVLVFARAYSDQHAGPWSQIAERGFRRLLLGASRFDGLFVESLTTEGHIRNETAFLYEQAFVLLAAAAMVRVNLCVDEATDAALRLRVALNVFRHDGDGFREAGAHPFQANAHMHLLEAALDWEDLGGGAEWSRLADDVVELALSHFINAETGALSEYFAPDWTPLADEAGLCEPGHHFEWAWLLERWSRSRDHSVARSRALQLFRRGLAGVDRERAVAVNSVWDERRIRDSSAKLWPQTEFLKAALMLGSEADVLLAARGLKAYLNTPVRGLWQDSLLADGQFVTHHAPATSLYHLYLAIAALLRTTHVD